ncbi:hypothetical protein FHS89_002982 [Rubricella aquisinus]|uniref:DUF2125 domain-containing protein n=1 Tax=Rubricella aquisinus TaxID=2028108 RepID=A0A840WPF6_9RHOB|nr:hypothetical protein [Rubricella aquisinus]MBB5516938.1 hypothetical protein [Rubricella aquisinus]
MKKLAWAVIALFIAYTAGWYYQSKQIQQTLNIVEAGSTADLSYSARMVSGYPFAIEVTYTDLLIVDDLSFTEGGETAATLVYGIPNVTLRSGLLDRGVVTGAIPDMVTLDLLFANGLRIPQRFETSEGVMSFQMDETRIQFQATAPGVTQTVAVPDTLDATEPGEELVVEFSDVAVMGSVPATAAGGMTNITFSTNGSATTFDRTTTDANGHTSRSRQAFVAEGGTFTFTSGPDGSFEISSSSDGTESILSQTRLGALNTQTQMDVVQTTGPSEFRLSRGTDGFVMTVDQLDVGFESVTSVSNAPGAGMAIGGTMARFGLGLELPDDLSSGKRPFALTFNMQDLLPNDQTIALYDPSGVFADHATSVDLAMNGSVTIAPGIDGLEALLSHSQPFEEAVMQVERASVAALGAAASANGRVLVRGPRPEDTLLRLNLTVTGVQVLVNQLVRAGLLPPENAGVFVQMIDALTAPTDVENQRMSEIIYQNGRLVMNGVPL